MLTLDKPTDEAQVAAERDDLAKALYDILLSHGDIAAGCPCDEKTLVSVAREHVGRVDKATAEEERIFA